MIRDHPPGISEPTGRSGLDQETLKISDILAGHDQGDEKPEIIDRT